MLGRHKNKPNPQPHRRSEQELVRAARERDREAFSELVERYYKSCYGTAMRMLRNPEDAEDEVQNALSKAFERIHQFQGDALFSTWLVAIVRNQCLMRLRDGRRAKFEPIETHGPDDPSRSFYSLPAPGYSPEEIACRNQLQDIVNRHIRLLPAIYRNSLAAHAEDETSLQHLAERHRLSVPALKSRIRRGRLELRRRLQSHCGDAVLYLLNTGS